MKKPKKILKRKCLTPLYLDVTLNDLIKTLQKYKRIYEKEGYKDLCVKTEYYGNDNQDVFLIGYKQETDEEYNQRIAAEKSRKESQKERERKIYLELKKKFEK